MADHVDPYRIYLDHARSQPLAAALADFYTNVDEAEEVAAELDNLFLPFRTRTMAGRRHFAPSSAWRDELAMLPPGEMPTPQRFVVRVHLFEDSGGQAGRYLGFVSLRPPRAAKFQKRRSRQAHRLFRYVIDAELAAPGYMQRPRYHVLTTTASSGRLGVLPFRSAVYSTPSLRDKGAACTHLAVSQALHLIMGRFGCRPISQEEFRWHLWRHTKRMQGQTIGEVSDNGANLWDALKVIRNSCNGGGFLRSVWPEENQDTLSDRERRLVYRHLTDCLACGLPVIAIVKAGRLLTHEIQQDLIRAGKGAQLNIPHAVLILGMHLLHSQEELPHQSANGSMRVDHAELPGRLIVHDTVHRGPFFEWMMSDFIDAAIEAYPGADRGVHMLTVGPHQMNLGAHRARSATEDVLDGILMNLALMGGQDTSGNSDLDALNSYLRSTDVQTSAAEDASQWSIVCRLLSSVEICQRYEGRSNMLVRHGDFDHLPTSFAWVVEVRHPQAMAANARPLPATPDDLPPALVHVWDATKEPENPIDRSHGITPEMILVYQSEPPHHHGRPS